MTANPMNHKEKKLKKEVLPFGCPACYTSAHTIKEEKDLRSLRL
jgi:hypothetical protein